MPDLEPADILIHTGDFTFRGKQTEVIGQLNWLERQKSKFNHIIVTPGNHDFFYESNPDLAKAECESREIILLNEDEITIDGIKFYGSPITPFFHNWAFNRRAHEIEPHWAKIPDDTNVLLTHGPPYGILDEVPRYERAIVGYDQHYRPIYSKKYLEAERVGCPELLERIGQLKGLKAHIFGHIHEGYGMITKNGVIHVNASYMDGDYKPLNKPIIIEI
jgi:Icc-related predicted phosphoesterase